MINYLIEFALIHVILFMAYKILLSRETQLASKRMYLLSSTLLALVIPLIQLPNFTPIENINITGSLSGLVLPEMVVGGGAASQSWYASLSWWNWLFIAVSTLLAIRFIVALVKLAILFSKSEPTELFGHNIRHLPELETSFTFFNWIFIDKDGFDQTYDIIRHEEAHIKYGHSYDLLLLNILTIPFWWVPSVWLAISELKFIHEYQADTYALGTVKYKNYLQTLIGHTLNRQGLILTNSFNDIPLTKRLKYMKQLKKKISTWKVVSIVLILAITGYTFSCQELSTVEIDKQAIDNQIAADNGPIFQIVDETANFNGGITEFYNYISSTLSYTEKAMKDKVSGKVFVEFVVNTNGTVSNVKILKGIGYGLDEEAKRVVEQSPNWIPGKQKGHVIRQRMVLPITFRHPDAPEIEEDVIKPIEAENMPEYPGGITAFFDYVKSNLNYPEEAQKMGLEGKVFVRFKVNTDGSISDVELLQGIGSGCDQEAKRVMENSPKWRPMIVEGKAQEVKMVLPIIFRLSESPQ
jgi:bla regulator protein blaR1